MSIAKLCALVACGAMVLTYPRFAKAEDWALPVTIEVSDDNLRSLETSGLREAILEWHSAWIRRDIDGCKSRLAENIFRVAQSQADIQLGVDAVITSLPNEWSAYETDSEGRSAIKFELRNVHVLEKGNSALVRYFVDISGGDRWDFEDTATFVQIFERNTKDDPWLLAFEADAWNLNVDTETGESTEPNFSYDFGIPVQNLSRAVKFYSALLGEPEARSDSLAVFEIKGSRLFLDAGGAEGRATIRAGLPNGWPIITPVNFPKAIRSAQVAGITFIGKEKSFAGIGATYAFEPGGNLIALGRHLPDPAADPSVKETVDANQVGGVMSKLVAKTELKRRNAWIAGEAETFSAQYGSGSAILDASHTRSASWIERRADIRENFESLFPFGSTGLRSGQVDFSRAWTAKVAGWEIVARKRSLIGKAPWLRRNDAIDTLVLDSDSGEIVLNLIVDAPRFRGLALDFDYAALPITRNDWEKSAEAFEALSGASDTYKDDAWLGFWGERAVLGLFEAESKTDHIPRRNEASAYLSLWVSNIEQALTFAREHGATLPIVPAINSKSGIDIKPGYKQVYLTDSEGNGLVLTEYTARKKR